MLKFFEKSLGQENLIELSSDSDRVNMDVNLSIKLCEEYHCLFSNGSIDFWQIFPLKETWRFFVEWHRQQEGIFEFEVLEKNYFQCLITDIAATIGEEQHDYCNHHEYQARHKRCTEHVIKEGKEKQYAYNHPFQPGIYRDYLAGEIMYELIKEGNNQSCTLEGIQEILEQISQGLINCMLNNEGQESLKNKDLSLLAKEYFKNTKIFISTEIDKNNNPELKIAQFFSNYKIEVQQAKSKYDVVIAIARLITLLERSHYFFDRNCMTNFRLLMDLCIQNEIPPPMMRNANIFEGFSTRQCARAILEGSQLTMNFIKGINNEKLLNGIDTQSAYAELEIDKKAYFNNLTTEIQCKISELWVTINCKGYVYQ